MPQDSSPVIDNAIEILTRYKASAGKDPQTIRVHDRNGSMIADLCPMEGTQQEIRLLTAWRDRYRDAFPTQFKASKAGTHRWFKEQVIGVPNRILFKIRDLKGIDIGHMGLAHIGEDLCGMGRQSCEIDNVVRGRAEHPGIMSMALSALCDWVVGTLKIDTIYLRVFSNNVKAKNYYIGCGFLIVRDMPLHRVEEDDMIRYIDAEDEYASNIARYFTLMRLRKDKDRQA